MSTPARTVTITDTTLRDGHQSLWAGRMSTEWMLPVARQLEGAGMSRIDVMAHAHLMWAVRFMHEDPWERIRRLREAMPSQVLTAAVGGQVTGSFRIAPDDVRQLFMERAVANGVDYLASAHGLLDVDVIIQGMHWAKALGARTILPLVFSLSPVHTDERYAEAARAVCAASEVDLVMIKDSGGLLTAERTASLVRALRSAVGNREITLHSHCNAGQAGPSYMAGVEAGVDDLQCGIWPLALGTAQPSTQMVVRNLRQLGYDVGVASDRVDVASRHLEHVADRTGHPRGAPLEYDHFHYRHQVPGGMVSNLETQLDEAGLRGRLPEILEETVLVREELGWPTMVTPYSQFVVNQAMFNVITGERYRVIPDEVRAYALGGYGALLAPIEPNVLDRIVASGIGGVEELLGAGAEPRVAGLRAEHPGVDDDGLLLRYMCSVADIDALEAARAESASRHALGSSSLDLTDLVRSIAAHSALTEVRIDHSGVSLTVRR